MLGADSGVLQALAVPCQDNTISEIFDMFMQGEGQFLELFNFCMSLPDYRGVLESYFSRRPVTRSDFVGRNEDYINEASNRAHLAVLCISILVDHLLGAHVAASMSDEECCLKYPELVSEPFERRIVDRKVSTLEAGELPELAYFLGVKGHSIAGQAVNSLFRHGVMFPQADLYANKSVVPDLVHSLDLKKEKKQRQLDLSVYNNYPLCDFHTATMPTLLKETRNSLWKDDGA